MLTEDQTIEILKKTNSLLEGHFILSSGLRSERYLQCAQLMMHADLAERVCESLAEKIKSEKVNFDLIASPAIGGILVGYQVSKFLNVPNIFVERVDNVFSLRRGFDCSNKKILILEDVITTGKSSMECAKCLENLGANIAGYACIVDRSGGKSEINSIISQISFNIPTYSKDNLPDHLKNIEAIKPGSRKI
jgi:orotate phosphoribosyltransferase